MIWTLFTLMIAAAVAFGVAPLLQRARSLPAKDARARHFARQLGEIEREADDGAISDVEAAALKAEAGRRLIAANDTEAKTEVEMQNPRPVAAVLIAAIIAAAGIGLYAIKGSPQLRSAGRMAAPTLAETAATPNASPNIDSVDSMIDSLAAKLAANPDNADGWRMLGWSYFNLGRYQESADAYSKAVGLRPGDAGFLSAFGEAQVMAAAGFVTPASLKTFDAALAAGTDDPRAGFFKALAMDQAGDPAGAISAWIEIANSAPADADWLDGLIKRIRDRAAEAGIDISARLKAGEALQLTQAAPPGPTQEQVAAAMAMPAGDRQAMIEGMVERLASRLQENPEDADGWIRLVKSRMALGAKDDARRDLQSALAAFADHPDVRSRIAAEAEALGVASD